MLFLRYLRMLRNIFILAAIIITPSLASFNYYIGQKETSMDLLNMLTWSNISPDSTSAYWLYVAFYVMISLLTLHSMSAELHNASVLCRNSRLVEPHRTHLVAYLGRMSSIHESAESLSHRFKPVGSTRFLGSSDAQKERLVERMIALAHAIERRETKFIRKNAMSDVSSTKSLKWYRHWQSSLDFVCQVLPFALQLRLGSSNKLYQMLRRFCDQLIRTDASQPTSFLLAFEDRLTARLSSAPDVLETTMPLTAVYVGDRCNLNIQSFGYTWWSTRIWKLLSDSLIVSMIIVWSVPMYASGSLSQLTAALQLLGVSYISFATNRAVVILQGLLPQIVSSALMLSFPPLLRACCSYAPSPSWSNVELQIQKYSFWFLYTELFVTTSIASGLVPVLLEIVEHGVSSLFTILAVNLPLASNYYLSYFVLQAVSTVVYTTLRPIQLLHFVLYKYQHLCYRDRLLWRQSFITLIKWGSLYPTYTCFAVIS